MLDRSGNFGAIPNQTFIWEESPAPRSFIKVNGWTISRLSHEMRFLVENYLARVRKNRSIAASRAWSKVRDARRAHRECIPSIVSHSPFLRTSVQFLSFSMETGALDARSINPFRRKNISTRLPVSARKRNVSFPSFLKPSRCLTLKLTSLVLFLAWFFDIFCHLETRKDLITRWKM